MCVQNESVYHLLHAGGLLMPLATAVCAGNCFFKPSTFLVGALWAVSNCLRPKGSWHLSLSHTCPCVCWHLSGWSPALERQAATAAAVNMFWLLGSRSQHAACSACNSICCASCCISALMSVWRIGLYNALVMQQLPFIARARPFCVHDEGTQLCHRVCSVRELFVGKVVTGYRMHVI